MPPRYLPDGRRRVARPRLDPEEEAGHLHALVDGLAVHGLMGRLDNETMLDTLDTHLNRIIRDP